MRDNSKSLAGQVIENLEVLPVWERAFWTQPDTLRKYRVTIEYWRTNMDGSHMAFVRSTAADHNIFICTRMDGSVFKNNSSWVPASGLSIK